MSHGPLNRKQWIRQIGFAIAVLLVVLVISPGIGSSSIGILDAWRHWGDPTSAIHEIAFEVRLPRTVKALIAGATLAMTGAVFQSLFRNVLATPYTLGIASGGSLGALIGVKFGLVGTLLGLPEIAWTAFAGCAAVVGAVLLLASRAYRLSGHALVLGGVTIGFFCSAMMLFVTYLADVGEAFFVIGWMMGSLDSVGHGEVLVVLPPLAICWLVLMSRVRALNQFDLGDEIAASRGVNPSVLLVTCIGFASLGTACVVSLCGPIGFVGLIVPQAMRRIVGRDHRLLLPTATLWGGIFLVVCDWLARLVPGWYGLLTSQNVGSAPLPIGVMTSVIGAPFFLILLRRRRGT